MRAKVVRLNVMLCHVTYISFPAQAIPIADKRRKIQSSGAQPLYTARVRASETPGGGRDG